MVTRDKPIQLMTYGGDLRRSALKVSSSPVSGSPI